MSGNFKPFGVAVKRHFDSMSKGELFRVAISGDAVWELYLSSFPEGTNPMFRVRTEHDGSYDRNFVRQLGNVVSITDTGELMTIWNISGLESPYKEVAESLNNALSGLVIESLFRTKERKYGYVNSTEVMPNGSIHTWDHFHAEINSRHLTNDVGTKIGEYNTRAELFQRGLTTVSNDALVQVQELVKTNTLYRGAEFTNLVSDFRDALKKYNNQTCPHKKNILVWRNADKHYAHFRNTVIGTLVVDLSEGKDLEEAVRMYESKVAPANYKRPTALITQSMIDNSIKKINELGIQESLERRHANLTDVSVNDVLWADSSAAKKMKGGLESLLSSSVKEKTLDKMSTVAIGIKEFMNSIVPTAQSMELFFAGSLQNNLMSVTAPVHANSPKLFKWDNGFAWSYNGNITDSIKERVKTAGGNVTNAKLRVSLAWFNYNDLDLHSDSPDGHVSFRDRKGILDVDMNAGGRRESKTPVENQSWVHPKNGHYEISVNNWTGSDTDNRQFIIEIENEGKVTQISSATSPAVGAYYKVVSFDIKDGKIANLAIGKNFTATGVSQDIWGIQTEKFVPVNILMNSPNYWGDSSVGNKHWFFILKDVKNPDETRGIYNEFLMSTLDGHRKVFEVLGAKTKCAVVDDQLSGLGFSSTKEDKVVVRVTTDKTTRLYEVQF